MDYNNIPLSLGMAITSNKAAMDRFVDMTEAEKEAFIDRSRDAMSREEMEKLVNTLTEDEERPDVHLEDVNDIFKSPSIG